MLRKKFFLLPTNFDRKYNRRTMMVVLICITLYPDIIIKDTMLAESHANGNFELAYASVDLRMPLPEEGSSRAALWIFSEDKVLGIHNWVFSATPYEN